jgi:3-oxoacyl-[acyl-carrier-protein] synthase-3
VVPAYRFLLLSGRASFTVEAEPVRRIYQHMKTIRILGTGSHLPSRVLTNHDLVKMGLDTSDEWIVRRTGISERRIADAQTTSSDLAYQASLKALDAAGLTAMDLDLIIMATITPDTCCPAGANWLEARLGAKQATSFDITAACSGFVFGTHLAEQFLKNRTCRHVLVVAAEIMSRTVNWQDRSTCVLWGDGAGAAILALGDEGPEVLSTHIHTDGASGEDLLLPGGGSKTTPITHESVEQGRHYLDMIEANMTFRVAVRHFMEAIREAAEKNRLAVEDIRWFIPHQANIRMFHAIARHLKIPIERFFITIHKYGNISSASCAIALDEAARDKQIQAGDLVCLPVFGGGLTWGSAMIRWSD